MPLSTIRTMPYPEWVSWWCYYQIEPWGFEQDEYRVGALLAAMHNANRGKGKKAKGASDFMRDFREAAWKGATQRMIELKRERGDESWRDDATEYIRQQMNMTRFAEAEVAHGDGGHNSSKTDTG